MTDPRQKRVEHIERLAETAFADHKITDNHRDGVYRHFRCNKPNTMVYQFSITTFPGRLVVTGDIGTLVVERMLDMFEWVPSAVDDISYFAEKVPREIATMEYDPEMAMQFISEQCVTEGTESKRAETASKLEDYIEDKGWFMTELHESGLVDGCDFPRLDNWTPSYLWCREAVRWFFRNYKDC